MLKGAVATVLLAVTAYSILTNLHHGRTGIQTATSLNKSYDYIIVGSGSAGSALASRLSEREDISVLLLEAGGHFDENSHSHMPSGALHMIGTDMDWEFYTEPQGQSMLAMNNRQSLWPRGKTLGGTSVINMLQFVRGSRFDFDTWEALGCSGWNYNDVLPYFQKLENVQIADLQNSDHRGHSGPIGVSSGMETVLASYFEKAFEEIGIMKNRDYNAEKQEGYSPVQLNVNHGVRSSVSKEYLTLAQDRHNLHIGIRSVVSKIKIVNNKAGGVFVIRNGRKMFIEAKKEVIVSAGAIKSPQLLMLSGIGPKEHLEQVGIPVVADLPVGKNLHDHLQVHMFSAIKTPQFSFGEAQQEFWNKINYNLFGEGPIAKTGVEVTAFFHTDPSRRNKTYADIQFNMVSFYGIPNVLNINESIFETLQQPGHKYGFVTAIVLNHPESSGVIKLTSSDPFDDPTIDPNYLHAQNDVDKLIKGIRTWENLISTKTMSAMGATIEHQRLPICAMHEFRSDEYWECYIRYLANTGHHPCCTCKMGASEDPNTVLDARLRVKGIHNLRVVDASVFPQEPTGNINAPIIMIAEKAADMILEDL